MGGPDIYGATEWKRRDRTCEARVRAGDADKARSEIKEFQICQDQKNLTKSTIHLLPSERCSSGRYIAFTTKLLGF